MKYLLIILFLLVPFIASAHGGVEKSVGSVTVYLSQEPLSPYVGEKVSMSFVFADTATGQRISDLPAELTVVDTYEGDESKDKIILTEGKKTDANGAIDFEYTFDKENYFDVELGFVDPQNKSQQEVGFLVQARNQQVVQTVQEAKPVKNNYAGLVVAALIGGLIGVSIFRFRK